MMQSEAEPQMSTRVGVVLKDRRLRVGLDIRDVSRSLRIREVYIEAIESGRFQALPAPVCALGFIRSYAELLRLDAEEIVSRYKQEFAHLRASPLRFPAPVESGAGAPTGAVLLLGAFIVIGGYAAWYVISAHRMEVAMVAPVPERLERLLEREDVQASTSSPSSHALEQEFPGPSGRGEAVGPPTSTTPPVGNASVRAGASAQATDPVTPAVKPELAGHAASAAEPASRTASGGSGGTRRITLKANAESWVEVRDPASNNARLAARLLRHGEVFEVPDKPGLKLLTGNAGGLVVMVDGEVAPPLGKQGMVRRDIDLDPELLRATAGGADLR